MTDKIILEHLGISGRMISGSKSGYRSWNPENVPIFNANLILEINGEFEKVWFGDIDLTVSEESVKKIAEALGGTIWVLPEMAARFENEDEPKMNQFVYKTDGTDHQLGGGYYSMEHFTRDENGKLKLKKQI